MDNIEEGANVRIIGNTYSMRGDLKALGLSWDGQAWHGTVRPVSQPECIRETPTGERTYEVL